MKKLYVEEYKPEMEKQSIEHEVLEYYYDVIYNVCIKKIKIDYELEVDKVYAFNYIDENDDDTYLYIVLKKESEDNLYYIAEYYGVLCVTREHLLVEDVWKKIDARELGIDLDRV